eukprot:763357-Hanusia_phi.AAC.4
MYVICRQMYVMPTHLQPSMQSHTPMFFSPFAHNPYLALPKFRSSNNRPGDKARRSLKETEIPPAATSAGFEFKVYQTACTFWAIFAQAPASDPPFPSLARSPHSVKASVVLHGKVED